MHHVPASPDVQPSSPDQPGLRTFKNWAVSVICLSFLSLVLTFSVSGQTLYGISNGSAFGPTENLIYRIDRATGAISNVNTITLAGFIVESANALAVRTTGGTLFAVVGTLDATGRKRQFVTIDPNTGVATQIGTLSQNIAGLSFRPDGTLWAVSGDGSSTPESLFTVNTSTAALTFQYSLGNGGDGEAIAFHPTNGLLYHSSGPTSTTPGDLSVFESVDASTGTVTPIGTPAGEEAFAMGFSRTQGQMYLSDELSDLYTVDLSTGARTFVATIQTPVVGGERVPNRGLAFFEATTSAAAKITGRLVTRTGAPVHKGIVTARDPNGAVYTAISDIRGNFRLVGLPTGGSYMVSAEAKRLQFPTTLINLSQDLAGLTLKATK